MPETHSDLLGVLAARLGAKHVIVDPAAMEGYLVEERKLYRGAALAVVRPGTTEEVAFVVRECAKAQVAIVPQGGNTGLVGGGVPHTGIVLSLARLDRVREVNAFNAAITVEAGCILKTVQDAASEVDCIFPLSLASEGSCRIGGNIATNAGGVNVLRYGNTRDLVLGLEVVLADGRIWNGLKGLRKDNTGYDLKNLFVGSEGTLGIITAAVLKLFPRPKAQVVAFVGCASPHAALGLFESLRRTMGDELTAFEYLPRFALEIVLRHASGAVRPLAGDHLAYALIEVSSPDPDLDLREQLERSLGAAFESGTIEDATIATSEAQNAALWHLRESLSDVQGLEGGSIKHDVSVPVSDVADFIVAASKACEEALPGVRVCAFGHFGDGNIHFNLTQPVDMEKSLFLAQWERFNRIVHDIVHAMNGSISAEHGVGLIKRDELARYKDPVALDLMRTLKQALDPQNILNPGKVVAVTGDLPPALPVARKA
ncbi:FAD-binding oxidoreductase [Microvirga sp. HBU67558]|uniref:FAD-binding oxidoreductase n=1 Tax=Microvirga TaxID=186650 RepID=UPI001B363E91|nr:MULTISPECIES: FAD-binding oxidoreductase [unclassified Microvirga]MBQ0820579.1 FAD-binding oxidoreductase [Microvirga sp. HBU67558]